MSRKSPAREFLRKVDRLKAHPWEFTEGLNPNRCISSRNAEFAEDEGTLDPETHLWTHTPPHGHEGTYVWRLGSRYCFYGMPRFTDQQVQDMLGASELEKVLVVDGDFEFVWRWDCFHLPNDIVWGLQQGPTFFTLRRKGAVLADCLSKRSLLAAWASHKGKEAG